MGTSSAAPLQPLEWKVLLKAAIIELDPFALRKRIEEARAAINNRLKALQTAPPCEETFKLLDALNALDDLARMQLGKSA
jgi:hypothetical protein